MKIPTRIIFLVLVVLASGCASKRASLEAFQVVSIEQNWDTVRLLSVDGRKFASPKEKVLLNPGRHLFLFEVSHMRGDMKMPVEREVPVILLLRPKAVYRFLVGLSNGLVGVTVYEDGFSKIVGGGFVYRDKSD
jgi:hypothetical protein